MTYEELPGPPRRRFSGAGRDRGAPSLWVPALALAAVQLVGSGVAGRHQTGRVQLDLIGWLLLVAGPALLLLRRRMPVAVAAGTAVVTLLYLVLGYPYGPVFAGLVAAFFSAVAAGHRKAVPLIAALAFAGYALVGLWLYRRLPPSGDARVSWAQLSGSAAWLLAVLAAAELFRVRRERIAVDRRERAEAARRKADEERMRIARELHDVLAHSISLINVQASVGLALIDEHPEQARAALATIKAASKEALGEVRQVLSTLRDPGDAPRSPAPGLDRLPELLAQAEAAGLRTEVTFDGDRAPLPPGADLAAFRIVQEALTNIVRHSGARTARVRLGYRPGSVDVQVDDDGPAAAGAESGGNGLVGMRERAAALGGTVETGPRPDGGFRVRAELPLNAPGAPEQDATPGSGRTAPPSGAKRFGAPPGDRVDRSGGPTRPGACDRASAVPPSGDEPPGDRVDRTRESGPVETRDGASSAQPSGGGRPGGSRTGRVADRTDTRPRAADRRYDDAAGPRGVGEPS